MLFANSAYLSLVHKRVNPRTAKGVVDISVAWDAIYHYLHAPWAESFPVWFHRLFNYQRQK